MKLTGTFIFYFVKFTGPLITMNTNPNQQNTRFAWTQASHNTYQKAVDGLGGPHATTVAAIIAAIPESDMELFSLGRRQLSRVLQSYLQRDRLPDDATVQERRARYACPFFSFVTAPLQVISCVSKAQTL